MIEQISLVLATPIAKAVLDKFYEGLGSQLGEKAAELFPEKVKQLGQLLWDKCLSRKNGTETLLSKVANGSAEDRQKLMEYLNEKLESDPFLKQETQTIAEEIYRQIQIDNVSAKNLQQIFDGQGLQVNEKQEQPIIQIQGNPVLNFSSKSSD
ncbi:MULTISPECIES: hypothetical protein [Spirulina sp. CCY15215]|uniref:hypothetical protein n=1 Tax=Spirulina sp. CCY15215 TaxID=2767591 RepID=UPI00194EB510|nr:hypothetical protein [Spirulina major]